MTKDKFFFIIVHIKLENNIYNVLNFDYIYIQKLVSKYNFQLSRI